MPIPAAQSVTRIELPDYYLPIILLLVGLVIWVLYKFFAYYGHDHEH